MIRSAGVGKKKKPQVGVLTTGYRGAFPVWAPPGNAVCGLGLHFGSTVGKLLLFIWVPAGGDAPQAWSSGRIPDPCMQVYRRTRPGPAVAVFQPQALTGISQHRYLMIAVAGKF